MDKKDLEEGMAKIGKGDDIIYENEPQKPMFVKEAKTVEYSVDEEAEYEKYLNLPEMMRAEFIDGRIVYLGEPSRKHQELLGRLYVRFHNYLHGKPCKVFIAPFGVKINYDFDPHSRDTLQPDLLVICNKDKLDGKVLNGTPDLVIEVLSPTTLQHDKVFKYKRYLSVGVKEYWLVDPDNDEITVNLLRSGKYVKKVYSKGDI